MCDTTAKVIAEGCTLCDCLLMPKLDDLLTSTDVARLAQVDVSTVARAAQDGKLKTTYRGPGTRGHRFFALKDVQKWLNARQAAA
jgi:hypothetical protein